MKDFIHFSEYLKIKRNDNKMTREKLAFEISKINHEEEISTTTIWRWETGKNIPCKKRQDMIITFFGDSIDKIFFIHNNHEKNNNHDNIFHDFLLDNNFRNTIFSNVPLFRNRDNMIIKEISMLDENDRQTAINAIIDFEHTIYPVDNPITPNDVDIWSKHKESLCIVAYSSGIYCGHAICIRLNNTIFDNLMNNKIAESDIRFDDLCNNGSLYVYSVFAMHQNIGSKLLSETIKYIISNRNNINNIGAICSTKDGINLARKFGLKLTSKTGSNYMYSAPLSSFIRENSKYFSYFSGKS